jgi:hypothetical protein
MKEGYFTVGMRPSSDEIEEETERKQREREKGQ